MKTLITTVVSILALGVVAAAPSYQWGLPGLDIVSRAERGANEERRYRESGYFDSYLKKEAAYDAWLRGEGPDLGGYETKKRNQTIQAERRSFLARNYPEDMVVDSNIDTEDGKGLVWPFQIVQNKRKIIIHHTADGLSYNSPVDGVNAIKEFYELHTLKKGRGDIGYNFLIDPFGSIYEGRAGGRGVVGAHADWNNTSTLGVALMGNFDIVHPTDEALSSLMQLLTVMSYQYRIDPVKSVPYYTPTAAEPYLDVAFHDSIVGHQDTKNTACPGDHLYELIPGIKQQLTQRLLRLNQNGVQALDNSIFESPDHTFTPSGASQGVAWIDAFGDGKVTCTQFSGENTVQSCYQVGKKIVVEIEAGSTRSSGLLTVGVTQGGKARFVDIAIVWPGALTQALQEKKSSYQTANPSTFARPNVKTTDRIDIQRAKDYINEDISVLLYTATADNDTWRMRCEGSCTVRLDGSLVSGVTSLSAKRLPEMDGFLVTTAQDQTLVTTLEVTTSGGLIALNDVLYRGKISIEQGSYKNLGVGFIDEYIVVNTLPFKDYMMGIGESSESQHREKARVLAVLAKQYALRYAAGGNRHPSVPADASYVAIDDPRLFQKYIGAGLEGTRPVREQAIKDTANTFVEYNGTLPILPYFHCSAGFTRDAQEVFGWTDTPRLVNVLDVVACSSGGFEGHGVGLSGDGAQELALQGFDYGEILRYYYTGTTIVR